MIAIAWAAALLATAQGAAEKPAPVDLKGNIFCIGKNRTLRAAADGNYQLVVHMEMHGDLSRAVWTGGKPVTAATGAFTPQITTGYDIPIGPDGRPAGRPKPFAITATMGRFSGGRPEPIDSLRLKIEAGAAARFPEMPLESVAYSVAVPAGKITVPDRKDRETEVVLPRAEFDSLVRVVENGERTLVLLQNGRELGRIPVPYVSLRGQTEEVLAWTARAAQAMTARKACPAS